MDVDYMRVDTMLTWETRECVNITIMEDNIEEGTINEDFDVQLFMISGVDFDPTSLEVEIADSNST